MTKPIRIGVAGVLAVDADGNLTGGRMKPTVRHFENGVEVFPTKPKVSPRVAQPVTTKSTSDEIRRRHAETVRRERARENQRKLDARNTHHKVVSRSNTPK